MSSNYYKMRDAKVRIAHILMNKGWKVYGYKEDKSDIMTDYFDPAYWDGIATKNGYVLVVDKTNNNNSGKEIIRYNPAGNLSAEDQEKIIKLEAMTIENGASPTEQEMAQSAILKIKSKISGKPVHEVIDRYPEFMANPGRSKWHIEKDGKIYDKGTGITKYSNLPKEWEFDFDKMEFKPGHAKKKELTPEELKVVNAFKTLIQRIENVVARVAPMGDGTEETEQEGLEAEAKRGYKKVKQQVKKKVLKMIEIKRDHFQIGDYITLSHHGHYWLITDENMKTLTWNDVKETRKIFIYEIVGSSKRGYQQLKNPKRYYDYEFRMIKGLAEGNIKIFELKEVEEVQEIEKWVKIEEQQGKQSNDNKENKIRKKG